MRQRSVRRVVLLGSPMLMAISSVLHPHPPFSRPGMFEFLRPRLAMWMGVHVVQLCLVFLLGVALWLLTEGLAGGAASVSRIATALFLVFYAAPWSGSEPGCWLKLRPPIARSILRSQPESWTVSGWLASNRRSDR